MNVELLGIVEILPNIWQDKILYYIAPRMGFLWNIFTVNKYTFINNLYNAYRKALESGLSAWNNNSPDPDIVVYMQTYGIEKNPDTIQIFLESVYNAVQGGAIPESVLTGSATTKTISQAAENFSQTVKAMTKPASTAITSITTPILSSAMPILLVGVAGLFAYSLIVNKPKQLTVKN